MFQIIGAMAEFERSLIQERVRAGLRNAKAKGKRLGRPSVKVDVTEIHRLRSQDSLGAPSHVSLELVSERSSEPQANRRRLDVGPDFAAPRRLPNIACLVKLATYGL